MQLSSPKIPNSLLCPTCDEYRSLTFLEKSFSEDNKTFKYNLPYYKCDKCNIEEPILPENLVIEDARKQLKNLSEGSHVYLIKGEKTQFQKYKSLELKYDARDYYFIPGLYAPYDEGFLTPVFFNIDLLLHYNHHPSYRVCLDSFSTVTISKEGEPLLDYGFGINRNGRLFAWLGDLHEFFSEAENSDHLHRFLASNIESDHDIISNYYFRDIDAEFIEHDNELRIIELKNKFEELISQKLKIKLFKIDITQLKNEYKTPIMNEKNQVFNAYTKLNSLLIENIDKDELKKILSNNFSRKELKDLGSLKLLEKFFSSILQIENSNQLISPLFVLYDLRILDSHLSDTSFDTKYKSCKERIGADPSINHIDFFREVIKSILKMFEEINNILTKVEPK